MTTFRNADYQTRVWPDLTDPDSGRTLELGPGDTVDLDLPEGFEDAHLVPVAPAKAAKAAAPSTPAPTEEQQ